MNLTQLQMNSLEQIKCGLFNIKIIGFILFGILMCCCLTMFMIPCDIEHTHGVNTNTKRVNRIVEPFEDTPVPAVPAVQVQVPVVNPKAYVTRKFEMLPESTSENAPKNMLFGEGEFIFTQTTGHVFIMADLYVIGGNLYAAGNQSPSDLGYFVYVGRNKTPTHKLGELKRSQDGRYKLEFNNKSQSFRNQILDNNYIQVRLQNKQNTLNTVLLEAKY